MNIRRMNSESFSMRPDIKASFGKKSQPVSGLLTMAVICRYDRTIN